MIVPRWALLKDFLPSGSSPCTLNYIKAKGYKVPKDKKTKRESSGKDGLENLVRAHPEDEVLPKILKARILKMANGFFSDEHVSVDQRMHPNFSFHPNTGRLSSRNPNLQNVPQNRGDDMKIEVANAVRSTIIAPEGFILVEADWKAIEAVLVGYFAEDETYIRAAKLGVHDILGSAVLHHQGVWEKAIDIEHDSLDEIKRLVKAFKGGWLTLRNIMKTVVHGAGYGRTVYAIAKALRISQAEAQLYMDIYHKLAPKVVKWQEATRMRAHKEGFLENPFGYRRYFWDVLRPARDAMGEFIYDKNGDLIMSPDGDEANEALAFLPQSTAAGMMREALLTFDTLQNEDFYPVVTVHDSVLFEVRITKLKHYLGVIREVMESPQPQLGGLSVEVESKMGPEWSGMEEVKWA